MSYAAQGDKSYRVCLYLVWQLSEFLLNKSVNWWKLILEKYQLLNFSNCLEWVPDVYKEIECNLLVLFPYKIDATKGTPCRIPIEIVQAVCVITSIQVNPFTLNFECANF